MRKPRTISGLTADGLSRSVLDQFVIKSARPIEFKDRQSVEPSKGESPATNGEDSIVEPLSRSGELPSPKTTSTSMVDPMKGIESDHGMCTFSHAPPKIVVQN